MAQLMIACAGLFLGLAVASAANTSLEGEWRLVKVQDMQVDDGGTLLVKDGHISGSTGCNRFRASLEVKGPAIKIAPVAATKMYCHDRAQVERAYLAALETVTQFEITGGTLLMHYQPGDKLLEFKR